MLVGGGGWVVGWGGVGGLWWVVGQRVSWGPPPPPPRRLEAVNVSCPAERRMTSNPCQQLTVGDRAV